MKGQKKRKQEESLSTQKISNEVIAAIASKLKKMGLEKSRDAVVAIVPSQETRGYKLLKYCDSEKIRLNEHPLDTLISNFLIEIAEKYDNDTVLVSTCPPTSFERGAIETLGINLVYFKRGNDKSAFIMGYEEPDKEISLDHNIIDNDFRNDCGRGEICIDKKPALKTQDSFAWCDDLKPSNLTGDDLNVQDELYMGLLYSALFILNHQTGRPYNYEGRKPIAAMLVNETGKPIAFSLNTSKSDKSLAHAETGMLLRYLSQPGQNKLPQNSKAYTTLETCKMCRPAFDLSSKGGGICELYGQKDSEISNASQSNQYYMHEHKQTASILKDKSYGNQNKKFYDFCRENYLGLKDILSKKNEAPEKFIELLNNIEKLLECLLKMRTNPYVGNPMLYKVENHPTDRNMYVITEKPDFEETYKHYFGDDVSRYRINRDNNRATLQGDVKVTPGSTVDMRGGFESGGGVGTLNIGGVPFIKMSGNSSFNGKGAIRVTSPGSSTPTSILLTGNTEMKVSKTDVDKQQGVVMGFGGAGEKIGNIAKETGDQAIIDKIFVCSNKLFSNQTKLKNSKVKN